MFGLRESKDKAILNLTFVDEEIVKDLDLDT
jgi:hypothetical protein